MVTHSICGALPLGIIVTSDETTDTLTDAFQLFKSSSSAFSFYGSSEGPKVFMTDNCSELREALKKVWPSSTPVLCIFHILQQVWRWLHEKKNNIDLNDRVSLLLNFKKILYAESQEALEQQYDSLICSDIASKYPNLCKYLDAVYEDCESWALCYRVSLPMRGNNTNNFCEAQFLVIKDEVLHRQKEINVVGLLDKFTLQLDDHYRNKLLSVASGKFDGIYSARFKGCSKKNSTGSGFKRPTVKEQTTALENVSTIEKNVFIVPSFSLENKTYMVDMNTGICQCSVGLDGSPCKHQFILWANKLSDGVNFLPVFSKIQRQMFAKIAIGSSMPLDLYEGLHDRLISGPESVTVSEENLVVAETSGFEERGNRRSALTERNNIPDLITVDECKHAIDDALESVKCKLDVTDQNFLRGILKFSGRVKKMPKSKLTTCFHSFGAAGIYNTRSTATSIVKAKRGKIHVQPGAVKRRKFTNGSRSKQPKGQIVKSNPFDKTAEKPKRLHMFAENVRRNEPVAKKAGRTMSTKTRIHGKET